MAGALLNVWNLLLAPQWGWVTGTALAADVADATRLRFVLLAPRQVWDLVVGIVDHLVSGG